jgi:hypothetical protein
VSHTPDLKETVSVSSLKGYCVEQDESPWRVGDPREKPLGSYKMGEERGRLVESVLAVSTVEGPTRVGG